MNALRKSIGMCDLKCCYYQYAICALPKRKLIPCEKIYEKHYNSAKLF